MSNYIFFPGHTTIRSFLSILMLGVILFPSYTFCADSLRVLTLEECIDIALEHSLEIQRYKELLNRDQEWVKAARANLKSNANIRFEVPSFDQTVEGIKDIQGYTHYAYTTNTKWRSLLNINQPLPTNGNVSINYNFFYHIQKSQLNNYSNYLYLKFEQPIFTPNTLSMGIRRAEIDYEKTELEYTNRRLNLIYNITQEYFNVYSHTIQVELHQRSVDRLRTAYKEAQNLFSQKKLEETDILQLEIEVSKGRDEVLTNRSQLDRNINSFKQLIGILPEEDIAIDTTIKYNNIKLDENKIVEEGLKRSTSLRFFDIDKEEFELRKVDAERESEFKGSIVATYGLDKKNPEFDRSFGGFDRTQSLMMEFYLPIWDWGKNRAQIAAAESEIRSSEIRIEDNRNAIVRGLRDRVNELNNIIRRLDILTQSRILAIRNFSLILNEFMHNKIKSQELILAQNQLVETDASFLTAYVEYRTALADLVRRLSGAAPDNRRWGFR